MKTKKTEPKEIFKETTADLLNLLDIPCEIILDDSDENLLKINIQTAETGILIGYHGETLSALQMIISLVSYKKTGNWTNLSLNVGNYKEQRLEQLSQMVDRLIQRVKETGSSYALPFLSSAERKMVHTYLEGHPDVVSQSEGESRNRRLFIKPKK